MVNSKQKGKRGEREFVLALREAGFQARRGQQFQGSPESPDVVSEIQGVHWEVKRTEKLSLWKALEQAKKDAGESDIPIVAHKANRKPWCVIMQLEDLIPYLKILKEKT